MLISKKNLFIPDFFGGGFQSPPSPPGIYGPGQNDANFEFPNSKTTQIKPGLTCLVLS